MNKYEEMFIELIEEAKHYVKGELELDCVDGGWYAMDYREDFEAALPIEANHYDLPLITVEEAESHGVDIIKCCDICDISYVE